MSNTSSSEVRVVCFDLGGVVVRTCGSFREACEHAGVPHSEEYERPTVRAVLAELEPEIDSGRCTLIEYYRRLEGATGGVHSAAEIARIHEAWICGEYEGMVGLIAAIHAAGVQTACLSNTNETHWEMMSSDRATYPAFAALGGRYASCRLGLNKPEPAIYRALEEGCGVAGAGIVFFDDREENLAAARAAGWRAHRIDPRGDTVKQVAAVLCGMGLRV
jgi:glucose-1-phosphatase